MDPEFEDSSSEFISLSLSLVRSDTSDSTEGPKRWAGFLYANIIFFCHYYRGCSVSWALEKLLCSFGPHVFSPSSKQRLIHDKDLHR